MAGKGEVQKQPGQEVAAPVQPQPAKPVVIEGVYEEVNDAPAGAAQHAPRQANSSGPPSTSSVLWAAWRQGLKDLQNAVLHAFPQGHVAQHEEPGAIANPTNVEVYKNRTGQDSTQEQGYDPGAYVRPQTRGNEQDKGRSR